MAKNYPTKIGYVPREVEAQIEKYLNRPQILALVGPRRSGKTTLLLHLKDQLKNASYLSFEDQDVLDLFENDIKAFAEIHLGKKTRFLFLDEFHYAKRGGKNLKYLFDFYPDKKIIISGSSSLDLTIRALKYLVGRVIVFILYPFSFGEFLLASDSSLHKIWQARSASKLANSPLSKKINQLFEDYLVFGGYPEVVLEKDNEIKKTLLKNIYSVLFLREVKDFLSLSDDYKLRQLVKALALQIGSLVNYQELGQTSGLDYKTLKRYLVFLEKVFVAQRISPFFTNKRKELVKTPKIYFWDMGLRNAILGNFSPLVNRVDSGFLWENAVFRRLGEVHEVKFWRTKAKAEVDFVLEVGDKLIPVEVKSGFTSTKIPSSLRSFIEAYRPKEAHILTSSFCGRRRLHKTAIFFHPAWVFRLPCVLDAEPACRSYVAKGSADGVQARRSKSR